MTRLSETTGGDWLRAADLPGGPKTINGHLILTITGAEISQFADGKTSLDLTFAETPKTFGCNLTNRKRLEDMTDDCEIEDLVGWQIKLGKEYDRGMKGEQIIGCRIQGARRMPTASQPANGGSFDEAARKRASDAARAKIEAAMGKQTADTSTATFGEEVPAEPAGFVDPEDPGFDESEVPF